MSLTTNIREPSKILQKKHTNYQFVEAQNYTVITAGPAAKSTKYHVIAHLAAIDPGCPIQLWCKFIPQFEITLNIIET